MKIQLCRAAAHINVARPICQALLGKEHDHYHRMAVGAAFMVVGVTIAKVTGQSEYAFVAYLGDGFGYGVHGLGLTPFIEFLVAKFAEVA